MSSADVGVGRVRIVKLLAALAALWEDATQVMKPENWGNLPAILEKIKEDWANIMAEFGGETEALGLLAQAGAYDYEEAAKLHSHKTRAYSAEKTGKLFDGTLLKLLITYGPTIYNFLAPFFGLPPLPFPVPTPVINDTDPVLPVG